MTRPSIPVALASPLPGVAGPQPGGRPVPDGSPGLLGHQSLSVTDGPRDTPQPRHRKSCTPDGPATQDRRPKERRPTRAEALMVAVVFASTLAAPAAQAAPGDGCRTEACRHRIQVEVREAWRAEARPYRSWIDRTVACESGSVGGYSLTTTGNGFWFGPQFTVSTWRSVGGRVVGGRPVRVFARRPDRHEQRARAVRVRKAQGVGAWPVCGGGA